MRRGLTPITTEPREKKGEELDGTGLQPLFPFRMIPFKPEIAGLTGPVPPKRSFRNNSHLLNS